MIYRAGRCDAVGGADWGGGFVFCAGDVLKTPECLPVLLRAGGKVEASFRKSTANLTFTTLHLRQTNSKAADAEMPMPSCTRPCLPSRKVPFKSRHLPYLPRHLPWQTSPFDRCLPTPSVKSPGVVDIQDGGASSTPAMNDDETHAFSLICQPPKSNPDVHQ